MARTIDADLPVTDEYRALLKGHIETLGRNKIAGLAGINPVTVWRNVNEENLTYTTAMKLRDAITLAYRERGEGKSANMVPPPFVGVLSQSHYDLCAIAAELHDSDGKRFGALIEKALELKAEMVIDRAKQAISHPLRTLTDDDDRGG